MDTNSNKTELQHVMARLDSIDARLGYLVERQKKTEELFTEMTPILREVMGTATTKLDELDKKGYFAFGRELLGLGDRVVSGFEADDVRKLGDALVGILQTVRAMTQPKMLEIAGDAAAVIENADAAEPIGLIGMVRATSDDDVQKGMAVMMQVMRHVGRAAQAVREQRKADPKELQKAKLANVLGARKKKALGVEREPAPRAAAAKPQVQSAVIDGVAFGADGHLVDPKTWTRDLAVKIAAIQGVELDAPRWAVVQYARTEWERTTVSANIRKLSQGTNLATKDLYALFPKAPARTVAKIAGIPKPAGCI